MNQPKVSIIVPIYKVEKYLMQCIDSILKQTLQEIEVILVDEGEMDACRLIIDYYKNQDSRVVAIHDKNGGYAASCNKGLSVARGEYIGIVESDDFIDHNMYNEMYNYAKKFNADIVKTPYYEYWDKTPSTPQQIRECFWMNIVKNIPSDTTFTATDYPELFGIPPSIWSCIYKNTFLKEKNIQFNIAKGAGYVDQHFRVISFLHATSIIFLRKCFYYYRLSNPDASTIQFDIKSMVYRWKEVHEIFENIFDQSIYNKISPYLLREEYVCTFEKIIHFGSPCTKDLYNILIKNISYTDRESILLSPLLEPRQKKELIEIKDNPKFLQNFILKQKNPFKCYIKIKINKFIIHLFKNMPYKIVRFRCNILNLEFDLSIGSLQ